MGGRGLIHESAHIASRNILFHTHNFLKSNNLFNFTSIFDKRFHISILNIFISKIKDDTKINNSDFAVKDFNYF